MKRNFLLGLFLLSFLILSSCATHRTVGFNPSFTNETWMRTVAVNPQPWTYGSDRWFMTGDPNAVEIANKHAPYSTAMSVVNVRVPNFTNLKIVGDFEVQIFGTYNPNSVYVYGPNDGVRQVSVQVRGNTLCITQTHPYQPLMRHIIVRIGMNNLVSLMHKGCSNVEGIHLRSSGMFVTAYGTGNMYLAGDIPMRRIVQMGTGSINVFGANTPCLDILTNNNGPVNVSGPHVGLRSIVHHAFGNINIVGATSTGMKIMADGGGRVSISGSNINLNSVSATNRVCVYAYNLNSSILYVHTFQNAKVGLMGYANNLYANAQDNSVIMGKYLCACNAYVRTTSCAHINVAAGMRIFAAATQDSSVYFYGSPNIMSQFVSGGAVVIPIWGNTGRSCMVVYPIASGKRVHPKGGYKGEI